MSAINLSKKKLLEMQIDSALDYVKVSFAGSITENAKLTAIDLENKKSLILDFADIAYINSAGVRRWILWMWNIEKEFPLLNIIIERCPTIMSKQIITIMRFVPKLTQVRSFYIPYFCEKCDENTFRMFECKPLLGLNDKDFDSRLASETCYKCNSKLLVDSSLEQFNKFINDYKIE